MSHQHTLSMQTFNDQNLRNSVSERQRKAAKKAWRTRRRRETPSPTQLAALKILDGVDVTLEMRFSEWGQSCRYRNTSQLRPRKVTMTTANVLRDRGWIECVERREVRDSCTHAATGPVWHWSKFIVWELSEKGRKAIERNER